MSSKSKFIKIMRQPSNSAFNAAAILQMEAMWIHERLDFVTKDKRCLLDCLFAACIPICYIMLVLKP